jgi:hypothetical protein
MSDEPTSDDPRRQIVVVLLAIYLILVQFPVALGSFTPKAPTAFDFQVIAFPSDLPLVALVVLAGADVVRRAFRRSRNGDSLGMGARLLLGVVVVMVAALLAHPSLRGGQTIFRLLGAVIVAGVISDLRAGAERAMAVAALAAWTMVQTALAVVQKVQGHDIGLQRLGEFTFPFYRFASGVLAPQGTMIHPYLLAGLAVLAGSIMTWVVVVDRRRLWWAVTAIAIAPLAFTYSRAGLLGYVLVLGCVGLAALQRRGRYLAAALALVVGMAVPLTVWGGGWTQRAKDTTGTAVDTGRGVLIRQSFFIIRHHPLLGVGPGRYVIDLRNRHVDTSKTGHVHKPVHNLPLLAAAEGGVLAGLLMAAMLVALGWEARRGGLPALAVFFGYLPFTLLDHFPYTFPQGLAMTAVWIGALDLVGRRRVVLDPVSRPDAARA